MRVASMTGCSLLVSLTVLGTMAGCKTAALQSSGLQDAAADDGVSPTMQLWNAYVHAETDGKTLQPDCWPKIIKASGAAAVQGTVFFFHGFTACPQQYFAIGGLLANLGWDVYLPLMPGEGRMPFDGITGSKDNFYDLPGSNDHARYQQFVDTMNAIAKTTPGPHVIAGLSGGGSLAAGAVIFGNGLWDRALLYAPYLKNAGLNGLISSVIEHFDPNYVDNWGPTCVSNRARPNGRNGLCAVRIDAIRSMTDYGVMVSKRFNQITVPTQITGVENDPTANDAKIVTAFKNLKTARLCFFKRGVPHSMINPAADAPQLDPYWVPALQQASVGFITQGTWYPTDGVSNQKKQPLCSSAVEAESIPAASDPAASDPTAAASDPLPGPTN